MPKWRDNFIWQPNDHTAGIKAGYPPPGAMIADNDEALGRIVDTISHSPVWKDSAVFVTEDDAQGCSDHVDAHRSVGLVISPYAKRGLVCHTHYDQASMLRTMELILGLPPMSMYDAATLPMDDLFTSKPDFTPYAGVRAPVAVPASPASAGLLDRLTGISAKPDLQRPDIASQDDTLNAILWESVKGTPYHPAGQNSDS